MSEAALPPGADVLRRMHGTVQSEDALDWRFHLRSAIGGLSRPLAAPFRRVHVRALARGTCRIVERRRSATDAELVDELAALGPAMSLDRPFSDAVQRGLAIAALMSERTLGLAPFASQLAGAYVLLSGGLAEMETGSGKTLTAALAAITAARAGEKVHLITANDYLAERDRTELLPLYDAVRVRTGLIVHEIPRAERAPAYAADVVYTSNKEIAFDYLRDRIALGTAAGPVRLALEPVHRERPLSRSLTMRGLPFAIIDEADSVLVDECRTPLIISAEEPADPAWATDALELAGLLAEGRGYELDAEARKVTLSPAGRRRLAEEGERRGGIWRNSVRREHAARQAIAAERLFHRDEHYVVREDKVELVDEYTGRIAAERTLADGLHQLIEAKEGVAVSGRRVTRGRMTYQRFFRRYRRLAGMTGTAREVAGELSTIYGLGVVTVPSPFRCRRRRRLTRICRDDSAKWQRVVRRVRQLKRRGRPVLIATRTIRASQAVSTALETAGIDHVVLNAVQDAEEGSIIAEAGQAGRVTVATNMAGRGVDIKLQPAVRELGGLHVILTERHEAGRIDRQVMGRCSRQGDPGSVEVILAWSDPLVSTFGGWRARWRRGGVVAFERAQRRAERLHARARRDLLRQDQRRDEQLAFTGSPE